MAETKQKSREVTDEQELFAKLGYGSVEAPGGEPVTTEPEPVKAQPSKPMQQQPETVTTEEESAIQLEEETEESETKPTQEQVSQEEQQRRTWQAEADRAKAEAAKAQEQIRLLQAQNQQLFGVVAPFMQKYGEQPTAQTQTEPDREPEADFIDDGYFEPKKFTEYIKRRDNWILNQAETRISGSLKKQREQETLQEQLSVVANEFPEYVNPLTGQVDTERLHRDLQSYTSKKTIVDLMREAKGIAPKGNGGSLQESLSAIERNADKPQAAAAGAGEEPAQKKPVPKKLKELHDKFGDLELPPNFDGLID